MHDSRGRLIDPDVREGLQRELTVDELNDQINAALGDNAERARKGIDAISDRLFQRCAELIPEELRKHPVADQLQRPCRDRGVTNMPAVAPSGGSGDLIKIDPIALPASGATTGAEAATVAARGQPGGRRCRVSGQRAAQPDGVSLAINAITSTWPAQRASFLADMSRAAGGCLRRCRQRSAAAAQDAENAAEITAVAPTTISV